MLVTDPFERRNENFRICCSFAFPVVVLVAVAAAGVVGVAAGTVVAVGGVVVVVIAAFEETRFGSRRNLPLLLMTDVSTSLPDGPIEVRLVVDGVHLNE
jgi:hypothetical protein